MTLFGWIFWGVILLFIIGSIVLQKMGIKPPEKTQKQIQAEEEAKKSPNYPDQG